ncbi:MAG: hypothetical protein KC620_07985 [Myxococcales bacterium]|nr:hypothetical protein [Myxococcales bacterium]
MKTIRTLTALAFALPTFAQAANVCVTLDDGLEATNELRGAVILVSSAFEEQGQSVVDAPCERQYKLAQITTGDVVTVTLRGPSRTRTARAASANELPKVYDQLVKAQLTGAKVVSGSAAVGRHNVTEEQADPLRVQADSLYYLHLGPGGSLGLDQPLMNIGAGYRYELDQFGVQAGADLTFSPSDDETAQGLIGSIGIAGLYFLSPEADGSAYLGAGLDFSGIAIGNHDGLYHENGLQGRAIGGYSFLRSSTLRMFAQADLVLPFYTVKLDRDEPAQGGQLPAADAPDSLYAAQLLVNVGIGF